MAQERSTAPSLDEDELDRLMAVADKAKLKAYSPYSNYRVGAALLASSGKPYGGCNVENSSYGLTICAERTALFKAASNGERNFKAIVVTSDHSEEFIYPCGACRQVLSEFGNMDVYMMQPSGRIRRTTLEALIPFSFSKKVLDDAEKQRLEETE
uniref:Cytidine deaminase n=1 Tax=Rhodosorus marinus TaxID=101924 RepID=A0A7S0G0F3_9RHOD|mmetsp:Transcript_11087/g.15989  ORF Transcript_11087/g.15989 Transcript_11087/m.15989 type:complete len:155 (+) Transcript_11087:55-519(+)